LNEKVLGFNHIRNKYLQKGMIYQHQYFQINTENKRVFDENGKELALTGNAYRVLVFLCEKKNADLTQIGEFLDWAKDYTENHLRQYRYKINTIISNGVVEYKNGIYSLIGEVKEADELAKNERITDLLQADDIKSETNSMKKQKEMKFSKIPTIIAVAMLLLSFFNWPHGYYSLLRIVVAGSGIYGAYYLYSIKRQDLWLWVMIAIAIIFNPLVPIGFSRSVWGIIDLVAAVALVGFIASKNKP